MFHFFTPIKPDVFRRFQGVQKLNIVLSDLNIALNIKSNIIIIGYRCLGTIHYYRKFNAMFKQWLWRNKRNISSTLC